MTYRLNWGEDRVYFHDDRGALISIPAGWTSLVAVDPWAAIAEGRSLFRLPDLRELAHLLEHLQQRQPR